MPKNALFSYHTAQARKELSDPDSSAWRKQEGVSISCNWKGSRALKATGRGWANLTSVRSCWNNESVFFLFLAKFDQQQKTWRVFLGIPCTSIPAPCPEARGFWRLNLFRMTAGSEANREHLAWRATFTAKPGFHVPASFGHLVFLDGRFSW